MTRRFARRRRIIAPVPRDAFISHASVDAELAFAICAGLEKRGLTCWIAPRDVRSEGTYGTEILRGLRESTAFLIVLTAASSESEQVEREAERASHYRKRIIPLSVGGGEPGVRLEFYTAGRQRVACTATIDDAILDRLAAVIRGDQPPAPLPQAPPSLLRRFPLSAIAAVIATAALALWLSGVFARPAAPPASDPTAKQDSTPPNQVIPPVQRQPDSSGTDGRANPSPAAPPVDKTLNHQPRGAVGPSPPPESRKAPASPASSSTGSARGESATGARGTSPLVVNGGTLRFVSIPRGTFIMGCTPGDEECSEDEKARKEVTVPAFQMSATEVTQAFWEATMGENPSDFNAAQQPVENVSWLDATKFVARLNQRGDGFTYRLPQETEWEYAARANGGTPEQLSSVAWFGLLASAGSDARPRDVARKRPNAFGLFDMLGNVAEWCEDWFSPNHQRVVRGGAWTDSATALRFSARGKAVPTTKTYSIGIRVVRTPASS